MRILLLHSGFSTWVEWRALIERLDADVLAPTLPGGDGGPPLELRGRNLLDTWADHAEAVLDEAGWDEPVVVVGSSYGGVCALELAVRGRASRALCLAPPWTAGAGVAFFGAAFGSILPILAVEERLRVPGTASPRAMALLLHGSLAEPSLTRSDAAAMRRSFARFPFYRLMLDLGRRGELGPGLPDFSRVDVPVTIAFGGGDRIVPRWMYRRWANALPAATVVTLPGLPHVPHIRDPDRIAALIADGA